MARKKLMGGTLRGWPGIMATSRDRVRADFATVASHQLRTPISVIRWALDMVRSGRSGKLTAQQQDYLDRAYQQNAFMARLVGDLLRISRIEEGDMRIVLTAVNLGTMVRTIVRTATPLAKAYNCAIRVQVQPGLPNIRSDILKLREVVGVLVDNAIHYGKRAGLVEIKIFRRTDQCVLTVRDHGVGIPRREQRHVFSKFFRGQKAIRLQTEGLGVQLYIARKYIAAMGGELSFHSVYGRGTAFSLRLPVRPRIDPLLLSHQPPLPLIAEGVEHLSSHLNDSVLLLDSAFKIISVNGNARQLLGLGDGAVGKLLADVFASKELSQFMQKRQERDETIVIHRKLPGEDKPVAFRFLLFPLRQRDAIVGWAVVVEESVQFRRADVAAAERIHREREFVSITVHELNGPLSANKLTLDLLRRGLAGQLNLEQARLVERLYLNNERQLVLVKDLLNLARLQQGRFSVTLRPTNVKFVVREVRLSFQRAIFAKRLRVHWLGMRQLPRVMADASRIGQVLSNLLSNAVKYTPPRGRITVSANRLTGDELRNAAKRQRVNVAHTDAHKGYLVFSVQDTGIGIPPHQLSKLFTMFFRSQAVLRLKIEGTGLGLYIAKAIVELHHGDIWCSSAPRRGTTFSFSLPIA